MVTVVTTTYNRAYILPMLYDSLCSQTNKSFEWLVIDDGSKDNTQEIVKNWIKENKIPIRYVYQENSGKSEALNTALKQPLKKYFFIVDSDDYVTKDAIEKICIDDKEITNSKVSFSIAGICYRKRNYRTNTIISSSNIILPKFASSLELAFKYKQIGDKAEVFLSQVLSKYPFPKLKDNKFVPEATVWYRIANDGFKFLINDNAIYLCDYISDGYTHNFIKNLQQNPRGFALYYRECLFYKEINIFQKIKFFIRYLQCLFYLLIKRKDNNEYNS